MKIRLALALAALALNSAADAADKICDRTCLRNLADSYVAALVAHDPSRVPLARDVRMVENIQRIRPGEGLWKSAAAIPANFRIHVPDVAAQQVGFMAVLQEDDKPVQLGLRLKLEAGRITEAEHVVARGPTFGVPGVPFRKIDYKPFDLPAVHIFKIVGGQIHEIEALGFLAPYNSASGWDP